MSEKCCCGCCKLSTGSSVALVFTSIEAILNLIINAQLLALLTGNYDENPMHYVINIDKIEDFDVFHGIVLASIGANAFWLASALFAISGNIGQSHGRLTPWIFLTYILSLFQFGVTIYFGIKFQNAFSDSEVFFDDNKLPSQTLTYLSLATIYSGGGVLIFFNLFLSHIVEKRGKEIDHDYSAMMWYIFSHMTRCGHINDGMQQNLLPEAPPRYGEECPPYLPREIFRRANDSSGSSWSVSVEALKDITSPTNQPNSVTEVEASINRNVLTAESLASLTRNAPRGYQILNIDTGEQAALPY